jgi:hypothetical protein
MPRISRIVKSPESVLRCAHIFSIKMVLWPKVRHRSANESYDEED